MGEKIINLRKEFDLNAKTDFVFNRDMAAIYRSNDCSSLILDFIDVETISNAILDAVAEWAISSDVTLKNVDDGLFREISRLTDLILEEDE